LPDKGYNFLEDDAMRFRVFGNAIHAMNRYAPDMILGSPYKAVQVTANSHPTSI